MGFCIWLCKPFTVFDIIISWKTIGSKRTIDECPIIVCISLAGEQSQSHVWLNVAQVWWWVQYHLSYWVRYESSKSHLQTIHNIAWLQGLNTLVNGHGEHKPYDCCLIYLTIFYFCSDTFNVNLLGSDRQINWSINYLVMIKQLLHCNVKCLIC